MGHTRGSSQTGGLDGLCKKNGQAVLGHKCIFPTLVFFKTPRDCCFQVEGAPLAAPFNIRSLFFDL